MKTITTLLFSLLFLFPVSCANNIDSPNTYPGQPSSAAADSLTLSSLQKINNSPFYTMTYYGDYQFAARIGRANNNQSNSIDSINTKFPFGCTCFATLGHDDEILLARNFDWDTAIPLLVFTDPPVGYASVSMVDLVFLGYSNDNLPDDWNNRADLLGAPYWPFDGMNEKGVAIGMMAVPTASSPYDQSKVTLSEIEAIRLVLDFAASTDEAIQLMKEYNIRMERPPIHYLITDSSGNSAIIEFVNGEMIVMPNEELWQVSTNFIIYGSGAPGNSTCWRYNAAYEALMQSQGNMTQTDAMNLLQNVSSSTKWSVVYNTNSSQIHICVGMNYSNKYMFNLSEYNN